MLASCGLSTDDATLVRDLCAGDESAFRHILDAYSGLLLRLARTYVPTHAAAEEVVQDTWLGVIKGLDRFEGRSSLKTWIVGILVNTAKTRGVRERRSIPFSAATNGEPDEEAAVDPSRFLPADHDRWPHHWAAAPTAWPVPEDRVLAGEVREVIVRAIDALPPAQHEVIALRDVGGWGSEEVCEALGITAGNQRVLLHRARSKVRAALERYYGAIESPV
jgi:RNA polymerase sigma-70 factor, ECF subfamily